jgi:hypothetical protein
MDTWLTPHDDCPCFWILGALTSSGPIWVDSRPLRSHDRAQNRTHPSLLTVALGEKGLASIMA